MPILHKRRLCQSWERLFPLQFMRWWTCPAAFMNPVWGPSVHLQQTYWTNSLCLSAAGHGTVWVAWWDSEEFACRSSISAKVPGTFYKPKIPYTILRPTRNHVKHLYIFFFSMSCVGFYTDIQNWRFLSYSFHAIRELLSTVFDADTSLPMSALKETHFHLVIHAFHHYLKTAFNL